MRQYKIALLAIALGAVSGSALAAAPGQGTVTFNGKLIADTCTIASNSQDIVVTLPTLSAKTFNAAGVEARSKGFDINVENCPSTLTRVATHFEAIGASGTNSAKGNLVNADTSTTAAANIEVRLYNSDEKQLKLGEQGNPFPITAGNGGAGGTATMRYYGGYYSTRVATAGNVTAKAVYTLAYP